MSVRLNCTLRGRYAAYFQDTIGRGLSHGEIVRRLIDGALAMDMKQVGPDIDRSLHAAKAELAEVMLLIGRPDVKAKLQCATEAVSRAHLRIRQVQT